MGETYLGNDPAIEACLSELKIKRYDDFTIPSFASFMGVDEATAKRQLDEALRALREFLYVHDVLSSPPVLP